LLYISKVIDARLLTAAGLARDGTQGKREKLIGKPESETKIVR
jgi:hypothetical protein